MHSWEKDPVRLVNNAYLLAHRLILSKKFRALAPSRTEDLPCCLCRCLAWRRACAACCSSLRPKDSCRWAGSGPGGRQQCQHALHQSKLPALAWMLAAATLHFFPLAPPTGCRDHTRVPRGSATRTARECYLCSGASTCAGARVRHSLTITCSQAVHPHGTVADSSTCIAYCCHSSTFDFMLQELP